MAHHAVDAILGFQFNLDAERFPGRPPGAGPRKFRLEIATRKIRLAKVRRFTGQNRERRGEGETSDLATCWLGAIGSRKNGKG